MNIEEIEKKYNEVKRVALKNKDNLTKEQIKVLRDMINENKRTDLIGIEWYKNIEPFIDDAYIQIVKNHKLFIGD